MVFFQTKAGYRTHNLQKSLSVVLHFHIFHEHLMGLWCEEAFPCDKQLCTLVWLKLNLISELFIVNNWPTACNESILMMRRLTKLHYVRMVPLTQPSCRPRLTGFVAYMVLAAIGAQLTPSLPVKTYAPAGTWDWFAWLTSRHSKHTNTYRRHAGRCHANWWLIGYLGWNDSGTFQCRSFWLT